MTKKEALAAAQAVSEARTIARRNLHPMGTATARVDAELAKLENRYHALALKKFEASERKLHEKSAKGKRR